MKRRTDDQAEGTSIHSSKLKCQKYFFYVSGINAYIYIFIFFNDKISL